MHTDLRLHMPSKFFAKISANLKICNFLSEISFHEGVSEDMSSASKYDISSERNYMNIIPLISDLLMRET